MEKTMKTKATLPLLFSVVLMDMVGFGFIIPLIPDYIKKFNANPALLGLLMAVYAAGQFIAAPIVGRLSDKYGRKPLFLFSIGGTFLSLLLLAFAPSLIFVFLARLLDGLTGGNITVAQSYIVDITDSKSRAKGLGLIGMAFGLGFIVGPIFGGFLARFGLSVPALVAAGIAFTNCMLILFVLPESLTSERIEAIKKNPRRAFSLQELTRTLKLPGTGVMLLMTIFYSFGFTVFESTFSLFAAEHLKADTATRGILLTYIGLVIAFVQGGLVGVLTKKFDERKLLLTAVIIAAIILALYGFSGSITAVALVLFPMSIASGIAGTLIRSLLSKSAPPETTGGTFGISASIESLNRIIAPILGAFAFSYLAPWLPGVLAAVAVAIAALIAQQKLIKENCLGNNANACYSID